MAQTATQEPTMEDILSSIRKIIADDDKPAKKSVEQAPVTPEPANMSAAPSNSTAATSANSSASSLADIAAALKANGTPMPGVAAKPVEAPVSEPEAEVEAKLNKAPEPDLTQETDLEGAETTPAPPSDEEQAFKGALMSPAAGSAASEAFDRLKRSASNDLDAKTEAILRPMLREWLDNNLPGLVERLVREEIERVARGDK